MTVSRPTIFWTTICVLSLAALVLLRPILLPFAAGMALAYLFAPVIDRAEETGIHRPLAALILVLLLIVGVFGPLLIMLPALADELRHFLDDLPHAVARVQAILWTGLHRISGDEVRIEESVASEVRTIGSAWLDDAIHSVVSGGTALFSLLSLLVVVPVVTVYLLVDWNRMAATVDGWLPVGRRDDAQALAHEIHETVAGFVRGQAVVCLILAAFYATALKLIGLDHAILIGVTAGLISLIPYFGAAAGLLVATCVAIAQFWPSWTLPALVGGTFILGEGLSDHVLTPRIIGSRVKLHPLWLMFSLFAFGYLFGFVGLLIAIPLAASLGVILRFAMRNALAGPDLDAMPAASASDIAGAAADGPAMVERHRIADVPHGQAVVPSGQASLHPPS